MQTLVAGLQCVGRRHNHKVNPCQYRLVLQTLSQLIKRPTVRPAALLRFLAEQGLASIEYERSRTRGCMVTAHLPRVLEPEVMDTPEAAAAYDATDFRAVNTAFCEDLLAQITEADHPLSLLDVGTGTARIPQMLAQRYPHWHITATDLSAAMLAIAHTHTQQCPNITLCPCDAKALPFTDGSFAVVISNSLIHHLPDPRPAFAEMLRVLRPGGLLFVRDLIRPTTHEHLNTLVQTYAQDCDPQQRQLFADSLHAALTLEEISSMLANIPQPPCSVEVTATSDRHWTVVAYR